jgi:2-methylisocitrate lyase-like PEP mutase family enzyme
MVGIPGKSFAKAHLEAAGVKRISLASSLYRSALTGFIGAAREAKDEGTFGYVDTLVAGAELVELMGG